MKVDLVSPADLCTDLRCTWADMQRKNPALSSPFFGHAFTATTAECRSGVRVGIIRDAGEVVGFLPFERGRFGVGGPVGGRLSDLQGVVTASNLDCSAADLVKGCGLKVWRFDHLLSEQDSFAPYVHRRTGSPAIAISGGFADYRAQQRRAGKSRIDQFLRKSRKLERERADVRFEFDSRDASVLGQVVAWKRSQCRRTGTFDFFAKGDYVELVQRIFELRRPDCSGILSVLWVGGAVAAAHFGMRSERTLHWWFPVYNHELGQYSPGGILLLEVLQAAVESGLTLVDLGKGDDTYKRSFMTHEIGVMEGEVVLPSITGMMHVARRKSVAFLRTSTLGRPIRAPVRVVRNLLRGKNK